MTHFEYPILENKSLLVIDSPLTGLELMKYFIENAAMAVTLVMESEYPDPIDGLATLARSNNCDVMAIHVPAVATSDLASHRIKQLKRLDKNRLVVMGGYAATTETENMYDLIKRTGFTVLDRMYPHAVLKAFAGMF